MVLGKGAACLGESEKCVEKMSSRMWHFALDDCFFCINMTKLNMNEFKSLRPKSNFSSACFGCCWCEMLAGKVNGQNCFARFLLHSIDRKQNGKQPKQTS